MKFKTIFLTLSLVFASFFGFSQEIKSYDDLNFICKTLTENLCPKMIDTDTRIDSITAVPTKSKYFTVKYHYTLINYTRSDIELLFGSVYKAENTMREILLKQVKNDPRMDGLRKENVTFIFSYMDKNKKLIFDIDVGPKDYNNIYYY